MEAVVLAGGLGTRLRPAVSAVPKPLAPVGGRPFLLLLLDFWIAQGVNRAVLAVGYRHEQIRAQLGNDYRGCELVYSVEDEPLGTGGALLHAARLLEQSTFLMLNGDTYFAVALQRLRAFHAARHASVTMALFRSHEARYTGVSLDAQDRVTGMRGRGLANGGVLLFERAALERAPKGVFNLEKDLLPHLDNVYGCVFDAPFVDIGVPEDWRAAEAIICGDK